VSLGRIYDDLGFRQLGINAAARSLVLDPASSAAHAFLSELYAGVPRLEVARASELLQSQLLQPLGANPVQPRLAFTDLDLVARSSPARVSFNEFSSLFVRDGLRADGAALIGTDRTYADEVAVTGLAGRVALSAGQFHYETDGFRDNNQLEHDIYTIFGQTELTESLSLQAEYRRRDTISGDRTLDFDLDEFEPTLHDNIDEDIFRVGSKLSLSPGHTIS
jgi:hypothetical protein